MRLAISSDYWLTLDKPLPTLVAKEIYNLCLDKTERQNHLTPCQYHDNQAEQVVRQGCRREAVTANDLDKESTVNQLIAEEQALLEEKQRNRFWDAVDRVLDQRSRNILLAIREGWTQTQIAEKLDLTPARISQLVTKAKEKVKRELGLD
jgi:RNA polymerase sigma factor (sigma-70 family)